MVNALSVIDWDVEHGRWEREMRGLTRALGLKALSRARRPRACWNDMVEDMEIASWQAWRSLRLRGMEPRVIGVWAVSDQAVRSVMLGRAFRPLQARGDRSHADSIHNRRNGVKVRSNREDWHLTGTVEGDQEQSDLMSDWASWKASLQGESRELVEALESGAGNDNLKARFGDLKRKKRALADEFRVYRES